jgi:hypothetical protein
MLAVVIEPFFEGVLLDKKNRDPYIIITRTALF